MASATVVIESKCECNEQGPIFCAKCGGILNSYASGTSGLMQRLDLPIIDWINELEAEGRLNVTLATFCAIDKQFRQGAPIAGAVSHAVGEIGTRVASMQKEMEDEITKHLQEVIDRNELTAKQLTDVVADIVKQQTESVMSQVRILLEEGKAITEAGELLKEAAGSVQAALATSKISSVRGEEAEIQTIQSLQNAFFGIAHIEVEPIGGADATDAIVRFKYSGLEVGRLLVEIKARRSWSNDFLEQIRHDMKRYDTALTVLVTEKLPRNAKGKGFSIDTEVGVIVTEPPELVFQTISMFYELHTTVFRLQKTALDLTAFSSNKDLLHYIDDNLKCLDDCKQISDVIDSSATKVKDHVSKISSRLKENNAKIAEIFSKSSSPTGE